MTPNDKAIWEAANNLQVAGHILENLRALFVAIAKLGDQNVSGLARIGQGIAEEWSCDLDDYAKRLFALPKSGKTKEVEA